MSGSVDKDDSKMIGSRSGRRREEKRAELKSKRNKSRRRRRAKEVISEQVWQYDLG